MIKYGEPFWLVVCVGRNKGRGHWTDGSVLGAKADRGIYVPVVPLDPKSGAMGDLGTGAAEEVRDEVEALHRLPTPQLFLTSQTTHRHRLTMRFLARLAPFQPLSTSN